MLRQTVQNQLLQRIPSSAVPFIESRLFKLTNGNKARGARAFSTATTTGATSGSTPGSLASDAALKTSPVSNELNSTNSNITNHVQQQLQQQQPHPRVETSTTQYSMDELFKNDPASNNTIQNIPQIIRPLLDKNSKGTFHFTEYHSSPSKGTFSKEYSGKYAPDQGLTIKQTHVTHAEANPQIAQNGKNAVTSDTSHHLSGKDNVLRDIEHETQALFDQTRHLDLFSSSFSPFSMGHSPFSHPFFTQGFGGIGRGHPLHRLENRLHNMMSDSENAAEEFGLSNWRSQGNHRDNHGNRFINRPRFNPSHTENTASAAGESKMANNASTGQNAQNVPPNQNAQHNTTGTNTANMANNNAANVNMHAQQQAQDQAQHAQQQLRQHGQNGQQNGQMANYYDQQRGITPSGYNSWIHDIQDGMNEYNSQLRNMSRIADKARARAHAREQKLRRDPFLEDFFEDFGDFDFIGRDPFSRHGRGRFWI